MFCRFFLVFYLAMVCVIDVFVISWPKISTLLVTTATVFVTNSRQSVITLHSYTDSRPNLDSLRFFAFSIDRLLSLFLVSKSITVAEIFLRTISFKNMIMKLYWELNQKPCDLRSAGQLICEAHCYGCGRSRVRFPGRSNRTQCGQLLATAAIYLWSWVALVQSRGNGPRHSSHTSA